MRFALRAVLVIGFGCWVGAGYGAEKEAEGPPEFEVIMADGSTFRVMPKDTSLVVETKYGKLTIPYGEIRKLELGFRYPAGVEAKVTAAAGNLGSEVYRTREDAEKDLLKFGHFAVPALKRAAGSSDAEVARRAEALLAKLKLKLPPEKFDAKEYDVIGTNDFTFRGKIESATVTVRTRYFGETALPLAEVQQARSVGKSADTTVTVAADKYAKRGGTAWLDSGVDVSANAGLEVTATGQVDLWPQEPGRYMCEPQGGGGVGQPGFPGGGGAQVQIPGGAVVNGMFRPKVVPAGALLGRVGPTGEVFVLGAKYTQSKAPATGRLYLMIAPSHWGNDDCTGEYKVTIKTGR